MSGFLGFIIFCIIMIVLARISKSHLGLYRDTKNRIIGGVCSGLAQRFEVRPLVPRACFVLGFLIFGTGIIPYIALWIVLDKK